MDKVSSSLCNFCYKWIFLSVNKKAKNLFCVGLCFIVDSILKNCWVHSSIENENLVACFLRKREWDIVPWTKALALSAYFLNWDSWMYLLISVAVAIGQEKQRGSLSLSMPGVQWTPLIPGKSLNTGIAVGLKIHLILGVLPLLMFHMMIETSMDWLMHLMHVLIAEVFSKILLW